MQKIKTWLTDRYHLLFKSAADNHFRIQEMLKNSDGTYQLTVKFGSYSELKKYQRNLRRMTVSLSSALAMVVVAFIAAPYVMNPNRSSAASFQWIQNGWNGAAGSTAATKTGWTGYTSKDTDINASGTATADHTANTVSLTKPEVISVAQTSDADFGAWTASGDGFYVSGTGTAGMINLRKPYLAACAGTPTTECVTNLACGVGQCKKAAGQACTLANECASNDCTGNLCTIPFYCGTDTVLYSGIAYQTVQIGTQCWFKVNLNVGTMTTSLGGQVDDGTIQKWCYGDATTGCDDNNYGGLYSWNEAMGHVTTEGAQGICPAGWHLPTDAQYTALTNYLSANSGFWCGGNSANIAKALAGTSLWLSQSSTCAIGNNLTANNISGFSAPPAGYAAFSSGSLSYGDRNYGAHFWSSKQEGSGWAWYRYLTNGSATAIRNNLDKSYGLSVRCLKD